MLHTHVCAGVCAVARTRAAAFLRGIPCEKPSCAGEHRARSPCGMPCGPLQCTERAEEEVLPCLRIPPEGEEQVVVAPRSPVPPRRACLRIYGWCAKGATRTCSRIWVLGGRSRCAKGPGGCMYGYTRIPHSGPTRTCSGIWLLEHHITCPEVSTGTQEHT